MTALEDGEVVLDVTADTTAFHAALDRAIEALHPMSARLLEARIERDQAIARAADLEAELAVIGATLEQLAEQIVHRPRSVELDPETEAGPPPGLELEPIFAEPEAAESPSFLCTHCDPARTFPSVNGLKIHIGRQHKVDPFPPAPEPEPASSVADELGAALGLEAGPPLPDPNALCVCGHIPRRHDDDGAGICRLCSDCSGFRSAAAL